jgi:hypothetical protein
VNFKKPATLAFVSFMAFCLDRGSIGTLLLWLIEGCDVSKAQDQSYELKLLG